MIIRQARTPQCFSPLRAALYATSASKGKAKQSVSMIVAEGARVLRVVQSRMIERENMLAQAGADSLHSSSTKTYIQRAKALKESEPLRKSWKLWNLLIQDMHDNSVLLKDEDEAIRSMAEEEHDLLAQKLSAHLKVFPALLIPPSKTAAFSALMEFRAGAGGSEASLFLSELLRMYIRDAVACGYLTELVSSSPTDVTKGATSGAKDAILEIKGEGSYDRFRFESGVHRVQRVPATETQGRLHTSTVAVVVLPTSSDDATSNETNLVDPKDVRTDVMRSSGAGGQHVNRTESAVRLTHEPTGITVMMQESRSQHANRDKAWQILRARLLDRRLLEEQRMRRDTRRDLVKSADRSEKVRTYNFPQDRLTDHRINYSMNNLTSVMDGDGLEEIITELQRNHGISQIEALLDSA